MCFPSSVSPPILLYSQRLECWWPSGLTHDNHLTSDPWLQLWTERELDSSSLFHTFSHIRHKLFVVCVWGCKCKYVCDCALQWVGTTLRVSLLFMPWVQDARFPGTMCMICSTERWIMYIKMHIRSSLHVTRWCAYSTGGNQVWNHGHFITQHWQLCLHSTRRAEPPALEMLD